MVVAVGLVTVQRLGELVLARRNESRLRARGAVEHGAGHYPAMVALHTGWLVSTVIESTTRRTTHRSALLAYAALQPLRYWVINSLGDRWTTRILVVADEPVVDDGAFRWFRHPNYMIVATEMVLLPLAFGARRTAVVATMLDAWLMAVRIPCEETALAGAGTNSRSR